MEFISEEIEVHFDKPPLLEKRPGAPDGFSWRGHRYRVEEVLQEWHDYRRRDKVRLQYIKEKGAYWERASRQRGSWGVGRDYYRVRTDTGQIFDIYYDRKPKSIKVKGVWNLWRQLPSPEEEQGEG